MSEWEGEDSNLRRLRRRFYRPLPLATRAPSRKSQDSIRPVATWAVQSRSRYSIGVAKDFSFDVVSEVDLSEVRNAQANREIMTRFDFKNTGTSLALDDDLIEVRSSTENRLKAAVVVLKEKLVRREVPLKALHEGPVLAAAKGTVKQTLNVNRGISEEKAREIVKFVKGLGLKTQTQIQGDQLRVTGKTKDDLQAVIRSIKEHDFDIPLQFTNYRP